MLPASAGSIPTTSVRYAMSNTLNVFRMTASPSDPRPQPMTTEWFSIMVPDA